MTKQTISLCMITKNEESLLSQALSSVQSLVDEIVIVDTGSNDTTLEIAKKYNSKIINFNWTDDFSAARNASIENATGDWILVIDADELIAKRDHETIRQLISSSHSEMYMLIQTTYCQDNAVFGWVPNLLNEPEGHGYSGYYESPLVRLFKNKPEIRFKGRIHEHVVHSNLKVKEVKTDVRIHHYGKVAINETAIKSKDLLYLRLGEEKCKDSPDNFQAWYELGVQYWNMEKYEEGKAALEKSLKINPNYSRTLIALASLETKANNPKKAVDYYLQVLDIDKDNIMPFLALPTLLADINQFSFAEQIMSIGESKVSSYPMFYINSGVVLMRMGNYRKSINCFERALQLSPNEGLAILNLGVLHMELQQWSQAREYLREALNIKSVRNSALKKIAEWHFRRKELTETCSWLEKARDEFPNDNEVLYQLAVTAIQMGQLGSARETLSHIDSFKEFDTISLERLQQCFKAVGDYNNADKIERQLNT